MPDQQPRMIQPYTQFSGPDAPTKDFSMQPVRVDHRHPVTAPEVPTEPTVEIGGQVMTQEQYDAAQFPLKGQDPGPVEPEGIAPDAEPIPTPLTPTPRPDGQPPAPDATTTVLTAPVAAVAVPEGSGTTTS
jgi:hypothetical protein